MEIDDNTQLVISLDVLHQEDERLIRLVQVATPTGVGQQRTCYVLVTSLYTYVLRKGVCVCVCVCVTIPWCSPDGIEGNYSREVAIKYSEYDHIVVSAAASL